MPETATEFQTDMKFIVLVKWALFKLSVRLFKAVNFLVCCWGGRGWGVEKEVARKVVRLGSVNLWRGICFTCGFA